MIQIPICLNVKHLFQGKTKNYRKIDKPIKKTDKKIHKTRTKMIQSDRIIKNKNRIVSTLRVRKLSEKFIQKIADKLADKYPSKNSRLEAEKIFKWCMTSRTSSY